MREDIKTLTELCEISKRCGILKGVYPLPDDLVCGFDIPLTDDMLLHFGPDYNGGFEVKLRITTQSIPDIRINISEGLLRSDVEKCITILTALKALPSAPSDKENARVEQCDGADIPASIKNGREGFTGAP